MNRRLPWVLALCALPACADIKLPAIISDHMLIQQQMPVRVWGKAAPGEAVSVEMAGARASSVADGSGKWEAYLPPSNAGGPFEMTIAGANRITVHDVLVGEVWVGSGQSNMELPMTRVNNADQEIATADFPQIRLFTVKKKISDAPLDDVEGAWSACTPASVRNFSAVGYFFSRYIHRQRHVAVGFIHTSWGGTPAQSWTTKPTIDSNPLLKNVNEDWAKAVAAAAAKTPPPAPSPNQPAGLWNAMVAPITPYAIRGVLWYQGESNADAAHAFGYRHLFRAMIEDWRREWAQGDFPFLFVQLANFETTADWPVLRESQTDALSLRNTGMAVIDDIGESKDIHPKNKQDVGKRLALAAQAIAYGEKVEYSGPMFRQVTRDAAGLRVWFDHTGSGMQPRGGGDLQGFEIAGADGRFVPAQASINGPTVVVSSSEVKDPVRVRYAWANDPKATLENREGLQAGPFRAELK
jgi:sialate O-acetylesterase